MLDFVFHNQKFHFFTTMIISWFLCSLPKIRVTFFYFTIQMCQLFLFLLEIEHCRYELLFVTPLIFYFLLVLVHYGLMIMKRADVKYEWSQSNQEEENNSHLHITRIGGEMLPLPDPRTFQRQSFPLSTSVMDLPSIELDLFNMNNAASSVLSQPPTYDEVMKKDSKVIIRIESDPEPPSYSEALVGGKCFPVVSV